MSVRRTIEETPLVVTIEQNRLHLLGFVFGWVLALLGPIEAIPPVPYVVVAKDQRSNTRILREGPFGIVRAEEVANSLISDAKRIGAEKLIFKIENGWRID